MSKKGAGYRLRKEVAALARDRPEMIWATHKESNVLLWSFLLAPPGDTVYGGGWYWGRISFPADYPFAPPGIQMVTPSGRFRPETKICMSMSDYHPESWNPAWSVATILKGVLSFMLDDELTTGGMDAPAHERRRLAAASAAWNEAQPEFLQLFPDFAEIRSEEVRRRASMPPPPPAAAAAPAPAPEPADGLVRTACRGDLAKAAETASAADASKLREAAEAKATGDASFRAKDFAGALKAYGEALKVWPRCAAVLRNRAAAAEKLERWDAVVADATAALELDASLGEPPSLKALLRRAAAREKTGASPAADYEAALALDPPNAAEIRAKLEALPAAAAAKKKPRRRKKKSGGGAAAADEADDDDAATAG